MSIRVALTHSSRYRYDRPVVLQPHVVRLRPAPHCRTSIPAYSLRIAPAEHFLNWQQDPFGNHQARLAFPRAASELCVEVDLIAEMVALNPFDFFIEEYAEKHPFGYEPALALELAPYCEVLPPGTELGALLAEVRRRFVAAGRRNIDILVDINQEIARRLRYDIRMEPGVFAPEETLERGHGSCRDFAWLEVQLFRLLGYAARFVSGYSIQLKADVKALDGPSGVGEDVADLHAWTEVYLPGAGWIGFDATSGLMAGEGHIPLACTAAPSTAAPITGSYSWAKGSEADTVAEEFTFEMRVKRIEEVPRVTKPYPDAAWGGIDALGRQIDRDLERLDVRLTMGGEPTFVSIDDRDAPEWNTAALGPTKRVLADRLLRRMQARFAPGGLLHHGQGKWYPGEPLPRWAFSCFFRADGEPVWREPGLFAPEVPARAASPGAAEAFMSALARRLGVAPELAQPVYEDAYYYLWRERRLPQNVDVLDSQLDDPIERARLARVFGAGLAEVAGHVLPLRARSGGDGISWESGPWLLRADRLYLIPGDSSIGFRLPIDSLPWESKEDRAWVYERDPLMARPPLTRVVHQSARGTGTGIGTGTGTGTGTGAPQPAGGEAPASIVRSALCVEVREGVLNVFMPPLGFLEEYLALVEAVEEVAAERDQQLRLEGYPPPQDHRMSRFSVTPDPGVIEVNVHPTGTWRDLTEMTTALYEEARLCRLGTEKFMLDGRHAGTGGGNHVVLGGPTPADSPFLRRPDMLRSLAGYFINHPSLSYLFSGLFVGPTSQAPRVDEARQDAIHELELAFSQVPEEGLAPASPWLVDRIFRHLFVDVTGNTHRTELCIDKLYSPDSASGRQGLVELRAFEMPPHPQMSLTQQLLLRGLAAWFWRAPYRRKPVRWGNALVDRFTLPHFVAQDFDEVLDDLRGAGYPFERDWFRPHHEFRFPVLGTIAASGIELVLRQAIEPWHVLGEEPGAGGTARYVDSSLERVEVKLRGMVDSRHVVACAGRRLPLHPTGSPGEFVAGVRFRAWRPPSALHPTVGIHAPLVFDVIDSWNGRAVAGCTYHVSDPGGRAHDRLPTNALEAEGRRIARFFPFGHTPGPLEAPPEERNPDFPLTLDLRRPAPRRD